MVLLSSFDSQKVLKHPKSNFWLLGNMWLWFLAWLVPKLLRQRKSHYGVCVHSSEDDWSWICWTLSNMVAGAQVCIIQCKGIFYFLCPEIRPALKFRFCCIFVPTKLIQLCVQQKRAVFRVCAILMLPRQFYCVFHTLAPLFTFKLAKLLLLWLGNTLLACLGPK